MTFLHLSLLGGTALIVVPLVLHLVMRRRPQRREFPALRFLQQRHDVNQRRLQLRHLLLLLLRMAAIALLALALARPSIKFGGALGSQEAPVAAALVFDTAPRMQYRHENRTRLEVAQQLGIWLLSQLPRESQIAVLDTRLAPAAFQVDRSTAQERISRLESVANSQPLPRILEEALRLVGQNELPRKEVYVFTDLAQAAWPPDAASRLQDRLAEFPGAGLYLIDVGAEKPVNVALSPLHLSSQILSSRSSLEVTAEVTHVGHPARRTVELDLLDSHRQPQPQAVETVDLEGELAQQVTFRVGNLKVGTHEGLVKIIGQDGLPDDDRRYFTVDVRPAWQILIAAPHPAESYSLFLTEALAPSAFRKQGRARFDCKVIDLDELATQRLGSYAAVCLLDPTPLQPAVWQKLTEYASDGHGVAVFLGRNATPAEPFNTPNAQILLPGKLLRQVRRPGGELHLAPRNLQHPVLRAFGEKAGSIPWALFPVFRYWQLDSPPKGAQVVVSYSDDQPALLERPIGNGRAMLLTTPVSDRPNQAPWNLLPAGEAWPFLILVNQTLSYLVGSTDEQLNYYAGQTAVLHLDRQSPQQNYLITTPQGLPLPTTVNPQQRVLQFAATDQPGNYRVQAGGSKGGVDRGFSVNLAADQTQLDRLTPERLKELFGPFEFRLARDTRQLDRAVSSGRVGRELFPFLILALALILGLEHVTANRFYKEEK